jgi:hypothetical protein
MASASKVLRQAEPLRRAADKKLAAIVRGYVLVLFVLHPLIMGKNGYADITETKLGSFAVLTSLLVLLTGLMFCTFKLRVPGYRQFPANKNLFTAIKPRNWAIISFGLALVIALALSPQPLQSLLGTSLRNEGLLVWTAYITVFLIISTLYRPGVADLLVFCAAAAVVALYGVFQYYGHDFIPLLPPGYEYMVGPRLTHVSTMSNIDIISTYMCLAFSAAYVLAVQSDKTRLRITFHVLGYVVFYLLLLCDVMSGIVGFSAMLVLSFPFVARERKLAVRAVLFLSGLPLLALLKLWTLNNPAGWREWEPTELASLIPAVENAANQLRPLTGLLTAAWLVMLIIGAVLSFDKLKLPALSRKLYLSVWFGVIAAIAIGGTAALPQVAEKSGNETLIEAAELLKGELPDRFGSNRGFVWKKSVQLFSERPVTGWGPDGFFPVFEKRYTEESMAKTNTVFDKAHNEYLQVLVDSGILGFICFAAFFVLLWRGFVKAQKRRTQNSPLLLAYAAALFCHMIQAFFNFSTPFAHPFVWVFFGSFAAMINLFSEENPDVPQNQEIT